MKRPSLLLVFLSTMCSLAYAQPAFVNTTFPKGTIMHHNVPYANDTLKKHLLDIYIPSQAKTTMPLMIWVHGGAWMLNDKYADMSYMTNTLRTFLEKGYAVASIDYRHSTTAVFPAQIQDVIQGIQFLHDNAGKYKFDRAKFVLVGFSAGGHLASLAALAHNNNVTAFYPQGKKPTYTIKAVLDFYGPSDFLLFYGFADARAKDTSPITTLLGASPLLRPDLSNQASPATYVDKNDPPFFIVHGEKDQDVPPAQSYLLKSYLDIATVRNEITLVKDAPHYGPMFDTDEVRTKLFAFLGEQLK